MSFICVVGVVCALGGLLPAQAREVVETYSDGEVKLRYSVDEEGKKSGRYEEFFENGEAKVLGRFARGMRQGKWVERRKDGTKVRVASWVSDQLSGPFEEYHENGRLSVTARYRKGVRNGAYRERSDDGERVLTGSYLHGRLNGPLKITVKGKTITAQKWKSGTLVSLDGMKNPHPKSERKMRETMRSILSEPKTVAESGMSKKDRERLAALRRLKAYRYLCGVPYEKLRLNPEFNDLCDAASEVTTKNGKLSHKPSRPPGMTDERFAKGYRGAQNSNLHSISDMVRSVNDYMDDSDPSNVDAVGHRRWCLNPRMEITGFGSAPAGAAMWSVDSSGRGDKKLRAVYYPPAGFVPNDFFGSHYAWSISLLKETLPATKWAISVVPLDEHYLPKGEPLKLEFYRQAAKAFGDATCLLFRPVGVRTTPGTRYLVTVDLGSKKVPGFKYIVEFVNPLKP